MEDLQWLRSPFHEPESSSAIAPRPLTMEEGIARQLDRIAFLRSVGQDWAEAVYQLRDMVVGLEDPEFWDGVPEKVRKAASPDELSTTVAKKYGAYGWNGVPCRAYQTPDGSVVFRPTSEDLSEALRIVMRLLARRGITWKRLRMSTVGPVDEPTSNGAKEIEEP